LNIDLIVAFISFTHLFFNESHLFRAISSLDRPFESDGEEPPPQDDAEASISSSINEHEYQHNQEYPHHEHGHHHQQHYQEQYHFKEHHQEQLEPESLSIFKRGLRDLAVFHKKMKGGTSQRMVSSRLHAAAIAVQVRLAVDSV
jgi:hypothetical protein